MCKYNKQNLNFMDGVSPAETRSSSCMLIIAFAGSSLSLANIPPYSSCKTHFIGWLWKIPFALNKIPNRKDLMGVSTGEAINTDRLNYTESKHLQPFTPGLNISNSQRGTKSAVRALYVLAISSGAGTAVTCDFREVETFLQWKN